MPLPISRCLTFLEGYDTLLFYTIQNGLKSYKRFEKLVYFDKILKIFPKMQRAMYDNVYVGDFESLCQYTFKTVV